MENTLTLGQSQAVLLDLISDDQLATMRDANKDNAEVVALIDARTEAKGKALAEAKQLEDFMAAIALIELPTPPPSVINLYFPHRRDSRKLTKAEWAGLKQTKPDITDEELDGKRIELDTFSWGSPVINKAFTVTQSGSSKAPSTRKLAITLNKRDGSTLSPVGNFRTSKEACEHLNLDTHKDSARRVLEAHKYIVDGYDGTEFLVKES